MKFASTRLIAADINTMVAFYELVTEQPAEWLAPQFAEIVTPGATLAIGSAETVALFREGTAEPGANRTAILEFRVDDVDAVFARLKNKVDVVIEPKLLPWGNRTAQFRDPEGTIISLFTPLTKAARARFGTRRQRVANRSVISIDNIQESGGGEANDLVLGTNLKKPVI